MSLFQKSVEKKYINDLDAQVVEEKYAAYHSHFGNAIIQQNIKASKEEEYQEGFVRDLFVNILGYTLKPTPDYNLVLEKKNVDDSKKADGAIIRDDEVIGVIELKSTQTTDLNTVESQAFGYKNHHPRCTYVITSNFEKIRLYLQNAVEYQEFDLFNLNKEQFALLYLCLSKDSILKDLPLKIKESSVLQEENVTKKLYEDYSRFREEIFDNIVKLNPQYDQLLLFRKTQKLLDRFLFIFFAEDRLLLPPNSISEIVKQWKTLMEELDAYVPLYDRFKKYFDYMNKGYSGKKYDIFPYNGGLFLPDDTLDNIKIDDEVLFTHTVKLSSYDFETDVDVNILGHIFEHSIAEIENIQAKLRGEEVDKKKTKRKKEGVYYTPKYITKYIVENTVGKLCKEKRKELGIVDEEYAPGRQKATKKKLLEILEIYRNWLLNITICDPACGSGAFLNQALDFLMNEHSTIDELRANLMGDSIVFEDVESSILERNLYGVDINDEAVEIAKLSLWLRTARKGRKLSTLSNNIKVGNSLIDDPEVAGDKAFKWEDEFPEIFAKGGFDVVIGNPPYVRQELLGQKQKDYFSEKYKDVYNSIADLYVYFYELSLLILRKRGLLGLITPNKWMERKYGNELRKYLKGLTIEKIINYGELKIFEDVSTEPCIVLIRKKLSDDAISYLILKSLDEAKSLNYNFQQYQKESINDELWRFYPQEINHILRKFGSNTITLNDYTNSGIYYGIKTGFNKAFIIDETTKNAIVQEDPNSAQILRKMVEGDDFDKWSLEHSGRYMIATGFDINVPKLYPAVMGHLNNYKAQLINRYDKGQNYWNLRACDYYERLEKPKIIYYHTAKVHKFYFDLDGYYISANCYFISNADRYLQSILNSNLFSLVKRYLFPAFGDSESKGRIRLDANKMYSLPIKITNESIKQSFTNFAEDITSDCKKYMNKKNKFTNLIKSSFSIQKISSKLDNWDKLNDKTFLKEIESTWKISAKENNLSYQEMSLQAKADWLNYFKDQKQKVDLLHYEYRNKEAILNQMVYELYGLTEEEIRIVEEAVK